jgi:hypothetical protein
LVVFGIYVALPALSPPVVGGKESKVQQLSRCSHGAVFESNLKSSNKVKHSEKICSVFGGHLTSINFSPKKWEGYYPYVNRHNFPPTIEE